MTTTVISGVAAPVEARADSTLSRVVRGAVFGELAGAVFALVTVWFTTSMGGEADMPLLMMSTVASGSESITAGSASVTTGVLVHLTLSALFGVLFALEVPRMRTNGTLLLAAGAYGLVVYVVNFRILSPLLFPVFQDANQPFEVLVHLVYGQLLALPFLSRGVRRAEPRLAWR